MKKRTKKVTFNPVLIQGPANAATDTCTEYSVQGGVSPASGNSETESQAQKVKKKLWKMNEKI